MQINEGMRVTDGPRDNPQVAREWLREQVQAPVDSRGSCSVLHRDQKAARDEPQKGRGQVSGVPAIISGACTACLSVYASRQVGVEIPTSRSYTLYLNLGQVPIRYACELYSIGVRSHFDTNSTPLDALGPDTTSMLN